MRMQEIQHRKILKKMHYSLLHLGFSLRHLEQIDIIYLKFIL